MALNAKQQRFVDEYLIDLNATQAAIRAGYSQRTAYSHGQRLLKDVEIADEIENAIASRSERTKIDADWLLARLADEAQADVNDLYDENGHLRAVADWPMIWRQGLVAGLETVRERDGFDEDGKPEFSIVKKIKLSDRVKRLELIGRHINIGAFRDNVKVEGLEGLAGAIEAARKRSVEA